MMSNVGTGWWDRHVTKEASKDRLKASDRFGNIIGAAFSIFVVLYFINLYSSDTGFFSPDITDLELGLFFWVAIFGIAPTLVKVFVGSKNSSRPLEVISSIFMLIAILWFLSTFPFDFEHLDDSLPESLRFILTWINDSVAKILMWLAVIVSVCMIPYTLALYLGVRKKLK